MLNKHSTWSDFIVDRVAPVIWSHSIIVLYMLEWHELSTPMKVIAILLVVFAIIFIIDLYRGWRYMKKLQEWKKTQC